ncbi:MAG: hypothetical protein ACI9VR_005359 [Cognaticolwellia sp.]|jgi:hypothetical protein
MPSSLLACAPSAGYPDSKLETIPWVEQESFAICETLDDCCSDEFCHEGDCLPHSARSFGIEVLAASVGWVRPDGGDWETSQFATTIEPDLVGGAYWKDLSTGQGTGCETWEASNFYDVTWNEAPCWFTVVADQSSMGLGPTGIANAFLEVTLWDIDSFDRDHVATWSRSGWGGAAIGDGWPRSPLRTVRPKRWGVALDGHRNLGGGEPMKRVVSLVVLSGLVACSGPEAAGDISEWEGTCRFDDRDWEVEVGIVDVVQPALIQARGEEESVVGWGALLLGEEQAYRVSLRAFRVGGGILEGYCELEGEDDSRLGDLVLTRSD